MEERLFGMIKAGVCAHFLIIYSCIQILHKLWYSSAGDSLIWYLVSFLTPAVLLLGGIYLLNRYKKKLIAFSGDDNPLISTAVRFIGGCVILALVFKYIGPYYLFGIISGLFDPKVHLLPLIFYGPLLIAAAVLIKRGSLRNMESSSSKRIAFLCFRTVLILFCVVSFYRLLVWFGPFIMMPPHELHSAEIKWIASESVFTGAALVLFFAPTRLKTNLKNTDDQGYIMIARQSFMLAGYLILIIGAAEVCNVVIRKYDFFDVFFFDLKEFLVRLLPALLLILVGFAGRGPRSEVRRR